MLSAALFGFYNGFSLIMAIGAQNAFVLRQGLTRRHVLPVVLTCALSDIVLIALGVAGFAAVSAAFPWVAPVLRYGGAAFLIAYGARSFHAAWRGGESLRAGREETGSMARAVLTCLAFTWLNPHVYLDTVVLIGALATQFAPHGTWFGIGASVASVTFFFMLGYGARLLAPVFARPRAWQVLDVLIGLVMWGIAFKLLLGA